jgi:predicted membrane channel-forming protein YqfA (hemolysin III family)
LPTSVDLRQLLAGGLVYFAALVFSGRPAAYHKPVWHGFVLIAVILQFAAIAGELAT